MPEDAGVSAPQSSARPPNPVLRDAAPEPGDARSPAGPEGDAGPVDSSPSDAGFDAGGSGEGVVRPDGGEQGSALGAVDASSSVDAGSSTGGSNPDAGFGGVFADAGGFDAGLSPFDAGTETLPQASLDLLAVEDDPLFFRLYGSPEGNGRLGVPILAGDLDGDGFTDLAMASFQASPQGRTGAGQVAVVFGSSSFRGSIDLGANPPGVLLVEGVGTQEATGSQIGIGDVNGDGQDDLLLCRQNFRASNPDRPAAGALTIVLGGPELHALTEQGGVLDLASPPSDLRIIDIVGANALDRFGMWVRTGDLTGDGIADIAVGADQQDAPGASNAGAVYVIRGGGQLGQSLELDLSTFGASVLDGHVAMVVPPAGAENYHFGATLDLGDLDRNGRSELVAAAALIRSGATYIADGAPLDSAVASGGAPGGRAYVVWDDNFPNTLWPARYTIDLSAPPGSVTQLLSSSTGDIENERLGEELVAGGDYDADGRPDLFVGDMIAGAFGRTHTGAGFVVFDAARLRTMSELTLLSPPADLDVTTIVGAFTGGIATDTVRHGDFDGDGVLDLAVASPNASPQSRIQAGTVHVLWGNTRRWPALIDLSQPPSAERVQITEVQGARGGSGVENGDMLAYSAEALDVDGDGKDDLVMNEMGGNGLQTGAIDVGNLLVLDGQLLSRGRPDCNGQLAGVARFDACGVCTLPGAETSCVGFEADVLPILQDACPSCHGASAGLSLFSYEQLMSGSSDHGPVVTPGDPEGSVLVQKLRGMAPFGDRMPQPPEPALSDADIATIAEWIALGARDN